MSASWPCERVQALIGDGPRRAGILAALAEFRDFAVRSATAALGGANAVLLTRTNPSSPEERVRFLASLELAVVVVLLWDEIEEDERHDLLGPWAEMAILAVEARLTVPARPDADRRATGSRSSRQPPSAGRTS